MKVITILIITLLLTGCYNEGDYLQGYIEGQYTYLSSIYVGRLQKLHVARGQRVKKGEPLFNLESQPEISEYRRAQADLASQQAKLKDYLAGQRGTVVGGILAQREQARADLELATANFNRTKQLFAKGVVSKANFDDSLAQLKTNQQRVNQFEQNLREAEQGERQFRVAQQTYDVKSNEATATQAQWQLNQKALFAPEDGLIFDTYYNEGEAVAANQPVVSLLAPRFIYVIFYVPEPLRATLTIGQRITFRCEACVQEFPATINYISAQAEYTPPVIFSRESRTKLVYRVQAQLTKDVALQVNPGQPIEVITAPKYKRKRLHFNISYEVIKQMIKQTNKWIFDWKPTTK